MKEENCWVLGKCLLSKIQSEELGGSSRDLQSGLNAENQDSFLLYVLNT